MVYNIRKVLGLGLVSSTISPPVNLELQWDNQTRWTSNPNVLYSLLSVDLMSSSGALIAQGQNHSSFGPHSMVWDKRSYLPSPG